MTQEDKERYKKYVVSNGYDRLQRLAGKSPEEKVIKKI